MSIKGSLVLAGLTIVAATGAWAQEDRPFVATADEGMVTTAYGDLLGFRDDGIHTFRGVPYAQAERFRAPEPPTAWDGVRLAMNYGEICPYPTMAAVSLDEQFNAHRYVPESEACQFLNIWTPGINDGAKRPVMVWLHGGGFTNGSSIEGASYEGANLSRSGDVVVVSLNHRLNVLGALDLSAYGPEYAESANTGMRDVVAALEWVRDNIEAFGGDPENVTIFGQSGGGSKVRFLLGAPTAVGLFDKAIVMSGAGSPAALPQDLAQAVAAHTLENLGLTADTIAEIDAVPYDELIEAGNLALDQVEEDGLTPSASWRPVVDGTFMPTDPQEGWAEHSANVPLLIGNVLNEFETIINVPAAELLADNKRDWTPEHTAEKLGERFGEDAPALAAAWAEAYPDRLASELFFFDPGRRQGVVDTAEFKAGLGGAPVYSYVFAWESPVLDGIAGAWHVADVIHAFNNAGLVPQSTGGGADALAVSHDVSQAFVAFARTGNPGHDGLPRWPAWTPETGATMIFDDHSVVRERHDQRLLDIVAAAEQD